MDNAIDAFKLAFAIFVFVVALSLAFSVISKAKQTSDSIIFNADEANYYLKKTGTLSEGRRVGVDTVISTLYKQAEQAIYIRIERNGEITEFPSNVDITKFVKEKLLASSSNELYLENITEINTSGEYKVAPDGTKVVIEPGETRTYVIYKKIN